ncbi:hypothetical protein Q1695_005753 [Nippostrongylus brasiliensis]|nr:hypothetical protein Q1695_005753 [Nippostrongylus brasiliensis]
MNRALCLALVLLASTVSVESVCFPLSPLGQRTVRYFADGKEFHFEHYSPGFVAVASCPAGMQLVGRKTALCLHGYWEKLGTCV